jgi:hypothetical protein
MASSITTLCSQILGLKNHNAPISTAIDIAAISGSHNIDMTNMLQQNKNVKITLNTVFNALIGITISTIPITNTTERKYISIGPSDDCAGICVTSPVAALVVCVGQIVIAWVGCGGI